RSPSRLPILPYTTLFRSRTPRPSTGLALIVHLPQPTAYRWPAHHWTDRDWRLVPGPWRPSTARKYGRWEGRSLSAAGAAHRSGGDRKSTRLNSSHVSISY